jgi:hypothetical protein
MAKLTIIAFLISSLLILNELWPSESAIIMPRFHNFNKLRGKNSFLDRSLNIKRSGSAAAADHGSALDQSGFDEMNRCILSCVKCTDDLEYVDEKVFINLSPIFYSNNF